MDHREDARSTIAGTAEVSLGSFSPRGWLFSSAFVAGARPASEVAPRHPRAQSAARAPGNSRLDPGIALLAKVAAVVAPQERLDPRPCLFSLRCGGAPDKARPARVVARLHDERRRERAERQILDPIPRPESRDDELRADRLRHVVLYGDFVGESGGSAPVSPDFAPVEPFAESLRVLPVQPLSEDEEIEQIEREPVRQDTRDALHDSERLRLVAAGPRIREHGRRSSGRGLRMDRGKGRAAATLDGDDAPRDLAPPSPHVVSHRDRSRWVRVDESRQATSTKALSQTLTGREDPRDEAKRAQIDPFRVVLPAPLHLSPYLGHPTSVRRAAESPGGPCRAQSRSSTNCVTCITTFGRLFLLGAMVTTSPERASTFAGIDPCPGTTTDTSASSFLISRSGRRSSSVACAWIRSLLPAVDEDYRSADAAASRHLPAYGLRVFPRSAPRSPVVRAAVARP
jgi:hypothetical protein